MHCDRDVLILFARSSILAVVCACTSPAPTVSVVPGAPCARDVDCAENHFVCYVDEVGGFCSWPCSTDRDCNGSICISGRCRAPCEVDSDCKRANAYCGPDHGCVLLPCQGNAECVDGDVCSNGRCAIPTCADGLRGGRETDVDCGGPDCGRCPDGLRCNGDSDCQHDQCVAGTCAAPSCTDRRWNADETDVDCGGGTCPACPDLASCHTGRDCASTHCTGSQCGPPSCGDGDLDQDETDVDCGGARCGPCGLLAGCRVDADCTWGHCEGGHCSSCYDGQQDGDEGSSDCGGSCPTRCPEGWRCSGDSDCANGVCFRGRCSRRAACHDMQRNNDETDVDCGGATCVRCDAGRTCALDDDCLSGRCKAGVCAAWICAACPLGDVIGVFCDAGVCRCDERSCEGFCVGAAACSDNHMGDRGCGREGRSFCTPVFQEACESGVCVHTPGLCTGGCVAHVQDVPACISKPPFEYCAGCLTCPMGTRCVNGTNCR